MGSFNINLPGNLTATVKTGKVKKIALNVSDLLRFKTASREVRLGYIVQVDLAPGNQIIYRLCRDQEGRWLSNATNSMTEAVINAIDKYETLKADEMPNRF